MIVFPNRKNFYLIIFFISLISIISALYIEYILQYQPCKLCIYQRLPYLAAIFVSFIGFNYSNNDQILIVTIMIFTLSAILSGYHFGIENSIFDELSACTNGSSDILNKSKLLESLNKTLPVNCKDATFKILGISLAAINTILSILIVIFSIRTLVYEKTNKKKLEEFIRVDHAGERGAIKIYEGQLLALNTIVKNDDLKQIIGEMKKHEEEHSNFFEDEIEKRNIKPTKLLPLWDLLGLGLGFGSTILGRKAAMLCTASVEEVIDEHYKNQIDHIEVDEKNLKEKIIKFRQDELDHKDIAYEKGATKKGVYSIMDKVIKTGSKVAIKISEKI